MSKWFRLDADAIRHPKVGQLNHFEFRIWIELLSLAASRQGHLPCLDDIATTLRRRRDVLVTSMKQLCYVGLIDTCDDGYRPHDWDEYQMKTDSSTERVRKWRESRNAFRNVSVTAHDTKRYETIQEKENTELRSEKKKSQKKVLKRSQIREDAEPEDREVDIATKAGMSAATLDIEWQRFKAHHMAKGSLMANWTQAWVTWTTNWKSFGSKQAQPASTNGASGSKYDWSRELELARLCRQEAEENERGKPH